MAHITYPTPYPQANALLDRVLAGAREALGASFEGMILQGSLAMGSFTPQRSDIDFVVVTDGPLSEGQIDALRAIHARMRSDEMAWIEKLEGSYIPRRALRRYDPADAHYPALRMDDGVHVDGHGRDWVIQRHVVREHGIALAGPDPRTLIDPVPPGDLRRAALDTLHEWWAPMLDDPFRLESDLYRAYAVLTMCRALYTVQFGSVASKPVAARWARVVLGEPWAPLIERALAWPEGDPSSHDPQQEAAETLDLIRLALDRTAEIEDARHPQHEALVNAARRWFHEPFEAMGYTAQQAPWGTWWSTGMAYPQGVTGEDVPAMLADLRRRAGGVPIEIALDGPELDASLGPALVAAGCAPHKVDVFLAHTGPLPTYPPVPGLTVEPVTGDNLELYARVRLASFADELPTNPPAPPPTEAEIRREMEDRRAELAGTAGGWLARVEGEPAAIMWWYWEQPDLWIARLGTMPPYRRRGIGEHLLCRRLALARERGSRAVLINCLRRNLRAQRLYRRLGFRDEVYERRRYTLPT